MRHSIPLASLSEEQDDKVNVVEEGTKPVASEWLVDSGASPVYDVTNFACKEDLNDPEATKSTSDNRKWQGDGSSIHGKEGQNTLELEDALCIPNLRREFGSLHQSRR